MAEDMNKSAAETEEEYQPDLMTLEDEDGNEVTFEVIDALDHKGVHYLAVVEYAENVVVERTYPIGVAFVEPLGQVDKFALELLVRNLAQGVLIVAHIV